MASVAHILAPSLTYKQKYAPILQRLLASTKSKRYIHWATALNELAIQQQESAEEEGDRAKPGEDIRAIIEMLWPAVDLGEDYISQI